MSHEAESPEKDGVTRSAKDGRLASVSSAVEIPQQDEVLKTLFSRFKSAPSSYAFVELASALLARGHAAEALSVADHGLMLVPENVDGRVERAAALLALGRPRVAYVELLRALAIEPGHRRTMRLLGRAFVDAGAPGRAAELLARRSAEPSPADHPPDAARPHLRPGSTAEDLPALFSALTKDLGLGSAVLDADTRRVEVTQIMRKRGPPRPPRTELELESIDGPIVETTQPGLPPIQLEREPPPSESTPDTGPPLHEADLEFTVPDEPLFQEHLPFAVRPVERMESQSGAPLPTQPDLPTPEPRAASRIPNRGDITLPPRQAPPGHVPHVRPPSRRMPRSRSAAVAVAAATAAETPRFEVVSPPRASRRILLAAVIALVILLYLGALAYLSADELRLWLSELPWFPAKILPP